MFTSLRRSSVAGISTLLLTSALGLLAAPSAHASTLGDAIAGTATGQVTSPAKGPCGNGGAGYYAPGTGQGSSCSGTQAAHAWCADFAGWVWAQEGVQNLGPLSDLANSFESYGPLSSTPHVGDAVFFHPNGYSGTEDDHVAIVTSVNSNGTIDWTGGNQSGGYVTTDANMPAAVGTGEWTAKDGRTVNLQGYISPVGGTVTPPPVPGAQSGQTASVMINGTAHVFEVTSDGHL
ncbi:CHAP domain-containing protein, partial [Kitasatospora sp. NPDC058965]|uniref:CHAP domain-containing protein n=1 Tax=Kitasatospora sp. NPDC058965 TaxID=3346682 RepID=UPI0036B2B233